MIQSEKPFGDNLCEHLRDKKLVMNKVLHDIHVFWTQNAGSKSLNPLLMPFFHKNLDKFLVNIWKEMRHGRMLLDILLREWIVNKTYAQLMSGEDMRDRPWDELDVLLLHCVGNVMDLNCETFPTESECVNCFNKNDEIKFIKNNYLNNSIIIEGLSSIQAMHTICVECTDSFFEIFSDLSRKCVTNKTMQAVVAAKQQLSTWSCPR